MAKDLCLECEGGLLNVRVGAVIMKGDRLLMVSNSKADYFYSVGGRIKFGETAEQAVIREVEEETGVRLEIDRTCFIHENFFYGDTPFKSGRTVHEICFYFYMRTPRDFEPLCSSVTEDGNCETLEWVPLDTDKKIFPEFFKAELRSPQSFIKHMVTDER